jgi:hypothetical protein
VELAHNLNKFKIIPEYDILIFDIKDLNGNIPMKETIELLTISPTNTMFGHIMSNEITMILENILNHNYIKYEGKFCKCNKGIAMRLPILRIISQNFIRNIEEE